MDDLVSLPLAAVDGMPRLLARKPHLETLLLLLLLLLVAMLYKSGLYLCPRHCPFPDASQLQWSICRDQIACSYQNLLLLPTCIAYRNG